MSTPISYEEQLANIRRTVKAKIDGVTVGDNTVIHELAQKVQITYLKVNAHITVNLADVQFVLGNDPGTDAKTVADAINASPYHVTFRTGQDDYDPSNARWFSKGKYEWAPAPSNRTDEAREIIEASGTKVATERDAALSEAEKYVFGVKS